ncbi:MAG: Cell wall surface anchor family protein [Parcubacteria group bacterium GW2011_GWC2_40_31]|nr:MAG: Cell wall surface anchor family protein [Parcubacteria group bacterium GW2011_GWA2_40_143]KKR59916.1 MAG: Cell wall surface anchor family protein [Parcubacteria group bacterium GW2011_GWC2_40_31]KKR81990.1 MAG: Cell wall surface anchor family protein [Parcubacteria group bacterium GW2011_GWD2_40_9]
MPFRFVSILLIIAFAGNLFFTNNNQSASAATYTFSQTNWAGGATANNAAHPTNQTSWDQFSASTTGMTTANSGADLQMVFSTSSANVSFDTEGDYIQEDATNGTSFASGIVSLQEESGTAIDSYTKLLLHANGSNGSTSFIDSEMTPKTVTANGAAQISTSQSKFGNSSVLFNNSVSSYVSLNDSNDWYFDSDFTIDFWIRWNGTPSEIQSIMGTSQGGGLQPKWFMHNQVGTGFIFRYVNGTEKIITWNWVPSGNTWYHVEIDRNGSNWYLFVNGSTVDSPKSQSTAMLNVNANLKIGADGEGFRAFGGWLDEVRISKGIARHISNFAVPSKPYGSYSSSQAYYVTTADASNLDTSGWANISSVSITQTTPTDTSIKYLISFDNRSTWKYWNGSAWTTSTLDDLQTNGMSSTTLEAITTSQWESSGGFTPGTLDFAADLLSSDSAFTPSLDDITINYQQYATSTDLTSSPYDSSDAANVLASISWTENLPSATDIKFQLRTAPDSSGSPGTWTSWLGPDGTSDTYFTDPAGGEAIPSAFTSGGNDQWVQYKVFMTGTGLNTPTLSDVTFTYVVNAAPEIQTVTASQGTDGLVTISYETRDSDTNSGTANPGYITPSFEYWNGASWTAIDSGLATLATTTKSVNQSTFTSYSTTWTASTTIGSQYYSAAKIRVTANDNEAANNSANAQSAEFVIDTTIPTSTSILVKATTTPATLTLAASDNSSLQMKISLNSDLSGASWGSYNTSSTISLGTDPDTVYAKFKDAYGNESAIVSVATPATPTNVMIQDTTNTSTSPAEYRLFIAWEAVSDSSPGFGSYHVYRSTDNSSWTLLSTIGSRTTNYYSDSTASADTTYYYKIATVDADGNDSYMSSSVSGTANGIQDGEEGGGGSSSVPPVISSVSSNGTQTESSEIRWTTDNLSNSVVGYCVAPCSDFTTNQTTVDSYVTTHSVTLSGLTPNTTYSYKVFSTDASSNTASSSGYTVSTNDGPTISNVSVINVSNVSADIAWNTNEAASGYVFYSTTTPVTASDNEAGWATLSASRTVSLTSLAGGTKYYFFVKSQDADNNWGYDYNITNGTTTYYTLTTPLDITPPTISGVASTTSRSAATITWITDETADSQVIYGATTAYGATTTLNSTLTRTHSVSLSSLLPSSTYNFKVISSDASGNQATSSNYTFATESFDIADVTASTVSNTSMSITWNTNESATSQVEYSTFSDLSSSAFFPSTPSSAATSHAITLSPLSEGTTYYYRASSTDAIGSNTTSQIYQFTTGDATAPAISTVAASPVADTTAVITWITDEPANSKVYYGSTSGTLTSSTDTDSTLTRNHSVTLSGLSYETAYYYQVVSSDGNSNTATSSEGSFTTLEQQINISQQTINTTTIVSGGGGGSGSGGGISLDMYNNVKRERDVIKKERDDLKEEMDSLKNKILGIDLTDGGSFSPVDVISMVINKFTDISESYAETTVSNERTPEQIAALEKDLVPAITSLRQLTRLIPPPKLKTEPRVDALSTEASVKWETDKPSTAAVYYSEDQYYSPSDPDVYTGSVENASNYNINHSITLKGLTPFTKYHYRLMSESEAGAKAYSSDFTFTTNSEMPSIFGGEVRRVGDTSIAVSWKTNIPANSAVIYTPIRGGKPNAKEAKTEGLPEFSKDHNVMLTNMQPDTVYVLEISSTDHFNNVVTKKLDTYSVTKDQAPPEIVQVRAESSILSGSTDKVQTIIYWKTDEPSTTKVVYERGANIKENGEFTKSTMENEDLTLNHIAVITSWEPGVIYQFRAVSVDAFGNEAQSKTFTVLTPKQKATVLDLIINNFSDTFNWTKEIKF